MLLQVDPLPVERCAEAGLPAPHWLQHPGQRQVASEVLKFAATLREALAPAGIDVLTSAQVGQEPSLLLCTLLQSQRGRQAGV